LLLFAFFADVEGAAAIVDATGDRAPLCTQRGLRRHRSPNLHGSVLVHSGVDDPLNTGERGHQRIFLLPRSPISPQEFVGPGVFEIESPRKASPGGTRGSPRRALLYCRRSRMPTRPPWHRSSPLGRIS